MLSILFSNSSSMLLRMLLSTGMPESCILYGWIPFLPAAVTLLLNLYRYIMLIIIHSTFLHPIVTQYLFLDYYLLSKLKDLLNSLSNYQNYHYFTFKTNNSLIYITFWVFTSVEWLKSGYANYWNLYWSIYYWFNYS